MPVYVDDYEISDDAVFAEMQHHPAASVAAAQDQAALALVIRRLLLTAATRHGIKAPAEIADAHLAEEFMIDRLLDEVVQVEPPDISISRTFYEQRQADFGGMPFETVADAISQHLQEVALENGMRNYVRELATSARIVGLDRSRIGREETRAAGACHSPGACHCGSAGSAASG